MSIAIIAALVAIVLIVLIVCWRKARNEDIVDVFADAFANPSTEEAPAEQKPTEPVDTPVAEESEKVITVVDDDPKVVEPMSLTVSASSDSTTVSLIENPWENCKTVECSPKPIDELEAQQAGKSKKEPKEKKAAKPRKTQLERVEETIAKLEGQIGRRSTLLKQLKKPVTKDERLNKWKASLKELKAARKALLKAAKKEADKKALFDRFGVPQPAKKTKK